jgi:hypothetical protein
MAFKEKLFEGKYTYYLGGKEYSQEDFEVLQEDKLQGNWFYNAEVLSRMKTGEFLRIHVQAEFTHGFDPLEYNVRRTLGDKESTETFSIDQRDKRVFYEFEGIDGVQRFDKIVNGKPHFATPCFSMSTVMINSKKLDPVHRTPYSIITSDNVWEYSGPFVEREIYMELQDLEQIPLMIGERELKATHCKMLQVDAKGSVMPESQDIFLSKYNFLPYKAIFTNEVEIVVDYLKNHESNKVRI